MKEINIPNQKQLELLKKYKLTKRLLNDDGSLKPKGKPVWDKIIIDKKVGSDFCLNFLDYLNTETILSSEIPLSLNEVEEVSNYNINQINEKYQKLLSSGYLEKDAYEIKFNETKNLLNHLLYYQDISDEYIINELSNLDEFKPIYCLNKRHSFKISSKLKAFLFDKLLNQKTNYLDWRLFLVHIEDIKADELLKIKDYINKNQDDKTLFSRHSYGVFEDDWLTQFWHDVFQIHTTNSFIDYIIKNKDIFDLNFDKCRMALTKDFKSIELLEKFINNFNITEHGWDLISSYQTLDKEFILKHKDKLVVKNLLERQEVVKNSDELQNMLKGKTESLGTVTISFDFDKSNKEEVQKNLTELKKFLKRHNIVYKLNN